MVASHSIALGSTNLDKRHCFVELGLRRVSEIPDENCSSKQHLELAHRYSRRAGHH